MRFTCPSHHIFNLTTLKLLDQNYTLRCSPLCSFCHYPCLALTLSYQVLCSLSVKVSCSLFSVFLNFSFSWTCMLWTVLLLCFPFFLHVVSSYIDNITVTSLSLSNLAGEFRMKTWYLWRFTKAKNRTSVDTELLLDPRFTFRHAVRIPREGRCSVLSTRLFLIRKDMGSFLDSDDFHPIVYHFLPSSSNWKNSNLNYQQKWLFSGLL